MRAILSRWFVVSIAVACAAALAGCARKPPEPAKASTPDVFVAVPTVREVREFEDFTGRAEAYKRVDIRPQITGALERVYFEDGEYVHAGDPLFDIDARMFNAQRDSAEASVNLAKARVALSNTLLTSAKRAMSSSVIAADEYAKVEAELATAVAAQKVAEAELEKAATSLGYTEIRAPFSGRLSNRRADPGNVVRENDTILTTLVVLDPINVTFDIDERTLLRIRRLVTDGVIPSARSSPLVVLVGVADREEYDYTATFNFSDNMLDQNTGTLRLRAEMRNPQVSSSRGLRFRPGPLPAVVGAAASMRPEDRLNRLLSPGMFVRIRLPVGNPRPGLLVPEDALGSDQGQKYVYVLNANDEVVYRRVKAGPQDGRMRVIDEGLAPTDRVIVSGLQRVRPGQKVVPKPAAGAGSPGSGIGNPESGSKEQKSGADGQKPVGQ